MAESTTTYWRGEVIYFSSNTSRRLDLGVRLIEDCLHQKKTKEMEVHHSPHPSTERDADTRSGCNSVALSSHDETGHRERAEHHERSAFHLSNFPTIPLIKY